MKILISEEKGTAIIMVALMMVVLCGFAALAIDGGNLYYRHTKLQDIADACALASCQQLGEEKGNVTNKQSAAFNEAVNYANKNDLTAQPISCTYSANVSCGDEPGTMNVSFPNDGISQVQVDIVVNSDLYFARVLGFNQTPVTVSARARLGTAKDYTGNLVPFCFFWKVDLDDYKTGQYVPLTLRTSQNQSGNFGYLDYSGNNTFDDNIVYGYNGNLNIDDPVNIDIPEDTNPGGKVGIVKSSLDERIGNDSCTWDNYCDENCPRIVILPVVNDLLEKDTNGKDIVHIVGFARFFLKDYENKTLGGYFLEKVDPSAITGGYNPEDDFMVQSVKLID